MQQPILQSYLPPTLCPHPPSVHQSPKTPTSLLPYYSLGTDYQMTIVLGRLQNTWAIILAKNGRILQHHVMKCNLFTA